MARTAKRSSGLYLCSRCGGHAFETLGMKLAHERTCTPASGVDDVQLHRFSERKTPRWLDGIGAGIDEAHDSASGSRPLPEMLARAGVTL